MAEFKISHRCQRNSKTLKYPTTVIHIELFQPQQSTKTISFGY
jgi:hypothetical protein